VNLKSFAKVNLYLKVINKRRDNYHNLKTIFERINLADSIALKPRKDSKIKVSCNNALVPENENNLCFRAAKLLRDEFKPLGGLDIRITKRIPVGAGLGGGSSNAASVLLGLNRLWRLKLSKIKLSKIAGKIGSDVAFFVYDLPFAIGRGRGEKIEPLHILDKTKFWHLLIVPRIHVSTPRIYKEFDSFSGLTKPFCNVKLLASVLAKKSRSYSLLKSGLLFNSLEQVTTRLYPEVRRIKDTLSQLGLECVLMSGSGPAVFAIVPSLKNALRLARSIKKKDKSWRVFVVKTV
jgi:4-diphosphocytidyl-2-C-methyl-D-erythritol kinase